MNGSERALCIIVVFGSLFIFSVILGSYLLK